MRLAVRHETRYHYDAPADGVIQVLRLTPRDHDGQFVRRWRVEIDADCRLMRDEDHFGNIVHTFSTDEPIESLAILVEGEVETSSTTGVVRGTRERFPVAFWLREGDLSRATPAIADFARSIAAGEGGNRLSTLHALMGRIGADMRFDTEATHAGTTAGEAFEARHGVCQDFAHIFIAASRSVGVPARYVSGYFLRTDTERQEAGHAWAEAHVDGLGWIGFDPAHGLCVDDRYVRVAVGTDYLAAAPVRGSRHGGAGENLSVDLRVAQQRMLIEG